MATITRLRPQSAATLASELESFLADLRDRRGRAENTIEAYRYDLRTAAQFLDQPLDTITTTQIEAFLSSRQEKPSTTNRRLASLKRFFKWALKRGLCSLNPAELVEATQDEERLPRPIRGEDIKTVDAAIAKAPQPYRLIFTLLRETGCRADEVLSLNVGDVTLDVGREGLHIREAKNNSERIVVLNADVMKRTLRLLRAYLREFGTTRCWYAAVPLQSRHAHRLRYPVLSMAATVRRRGAARCGQAALHDPPIAPHRRHRFYPSLPGADCQPHARSSRPALDPTLCRGHRGSGTCSAGRATAARGVIPWQDSTTSDSRSPHSMRCLPAAWRSPSTITSLTRTNGTSRDRWAMVAPSRHQRRLSRRQFMLSTANSLNRRLPPLPSARNSQRSAASLTRSIVGMVSNPGGAHLATLLELTLMVSGNVYEMVQQSSATAPTTRQRSRLSKRTSHQSESSAHRQCASR